MITTWLLRTLLVGLLLGVAALAAERVAGWLGVARRWVWVAAMVGSLAIPAFALWAPGTVPQIGVAAGWMERWAGAEATVTSSDLRLSTSARVAEAVELASIGGRIPDGGGPAALAVVRPSEEIGRFEADLGVKRMTADAALRAFDVPLETGTGTFPVAGIFGIWVLLSLSLMGVIAWGSLRLHLMRAESTPAVVDGVPVRLSRGLGPAVVGLVRPEVVIPRWVLGAPEEERTLILAHEREHIAARDGWLLALGMLALAAMPWNPALWWQHRRLRLAVETDCDARVVANGASRRAYGEVLLRAASGAPVLPWLSPAWGETSTHLERRILAITARRSRYGKWLSVPLLMVALAVGLVACDIAQRGRVATASPAPEVLVEDANPAAGQPEHIAIAAVPLPHVPAAVVDVSEVSAPAGPSRSVHEVYAVPGSLPPADRSEEPYFFARPIPVGPADQPSRDAWVTSLRPPPPIVVVDAELARHLEEISVHHAETVRMHGALEVQHRRMGQEFEAWQAVLGEEHRRSADQWLAPQRAEVAVLQMQDAVLATSAKVLHAQPGTLRSVRGQLEVRAVPIMETVRPLPHGTISGVITDPEGRAIRNAAVTLQPLRRGTVTNGEGRFLLHDIPPGRYTLMGVRPNTGRMIRREVEVEGGDRQTIHIVF